MSGARRKKLLYASPFPPMKSGISDYSEVLVYGLKEHFDITLLIDDYRLENKRLYQDFKVKVYRKDPLVFNLFDHWVYNIGNNPHYHSYIYECALKKPGLIILHDFIAYYLTVGFYRDRSALYSKIYQMAGAAGIDLIMRHTKRQEHLLECKELAPKLPLNRELINSENKIMVHSNYSYERVSSIIDDKRRLRKINQIEQVGDKEKFIPKNGLFKKYRIPVDKSIIASFGHIDPTKLNHVVCEATNLLNDTFQGNLIYLCVGEGDYIDNHLNPNIIRTGRVSLPEFNSFIRHSDIIVNLRSPSMGETSAAVIRALGIGKPCIVSDDAWFSELPDDIVVKISNKDLKKDLRDSLFRLLKSPDLMETISQRARDYIRREHGIRMISDKMADFLRA